MKEGGAWILFGNGEMSRVSVTLHRGKDRGGRPADAYVVTGGGLSRSARRAAESVYNWLQHEQRNPDRFVAAFDVSRADNSMAGESGGLAFAVALAARILERPEITVAATGEIDSTVYPGQIGRIEQVGDKAASAAGHLTVGDWFFYPLANRDELDAGLRDRLEAQGVHIAAVSSVAEALDLLFHGKEKKRTVQVAGSGGNHVSASTKVGIVVLAVIVIAAGGIWWQYSRTSAGTPVEIPAETPIEIPALRPPTEMETQQEIVEPSPPEHDAEIETETPETDNAPDLDQGFD